MRTLASVGVSVVLASYVRLFVWAKHIMLVLYGDKVSAEPERMHPFWQRMLRLHNEFPAAVSLSCVDTRYCDIGDWIHYLKVFHLLRARSGGMCYRLYCPRVPGPDYVGRPGCDHATALAHLGLVKQTVQVSGASVFVSTAHLSCAAVSGGEQEHMRYQAAAAHKWVQALPVGTRVLCVLAKARLFGWRHVVVADRTVPKKLS